MEAENDIEEHLYPIKSNSLNKINKLLKNSIDKELLQLKNLNQMSTNQGLFIIDQKFFMLETYTTEVCEILKDSHLSSVKTTLEAILTNFTNIFQFLRKFLIKTEDNSTKIRNNLSNLIKKVKIAENERDLALAQLKEDLEPKNLSQGPNLLVKEFAEEEDIRKRLEKQEEEIKEKAAKIYEKIKINGNSKGFFKNCDTRVLLQVEKMMLKHAHQSSQRMEDLQYRSIRKIDKTLKNKFQISNKLEEVLKQSHRILKENQFEEDELIKEPDPFNAANYNKDLKRIETEIFDSFKKTNKKIGLKILKKILSHKPSTATKAIQTDGKGFTSFYNNNTNNTKLSKKDYKSNYRKLKVEIKYLKERKNELNSEKKSLLNENGILSSQLNNEKNNLIKVEEELKNLKEKMIEVEKELSFKNGEAWSCKNEIKKLKEKIEENFKEKNQKFEKNLKLWEKLINLINSFILENINLKDDSNLPTSFLELLLICKSYEIPGDKKSIKESFKKSLEIIEKWINKKNKEIKKNKILKNFENSSLSEIKRRVSSVNDFYNGSKIVDSSDSHNRRVSSISEFRNSLANAKFQRQNKSVMGLKHLYKNTPEKSKYNKDLQNGQNNKDEEAGDKILSNSNFYNKLNEIKEEIPFKQKNLYKMIIKEKTDESFDLKEKVDEFSFDNNITSIQKNISPEILSPIKKEKIRFNLNCQSGDEEILSRSKDDYIEEEEVLNDKKKISKEKSLEVYKDENQEDRPIQDLEHKQIIQDLEEDKNASKNSQTNLKSLNISINSFKNNNNNNFNTKNKNFILKDKNSEFECKIIIINFFRYL